MFKTSCKYRKLAKKSRKWGSMEMICISTTTETPSRFILQKRRRRSHPGKPPRLKIKRNRISPSFRPWGSSIDVRNMRHWWKESNSSKCQDSKSRTLPRLNNRRGGRINLIRWELSLSKNRQCMLLKALQRLPFLRLYPNSIKSVQGKMKTNGKPSSQAET